MMNVRRQKYINARVVCITLTEKFVVYQYCGDVMIHFHDEDFFSKVKTALIDQYPTLGRRLTSMTGHGPQYITDQCGHDVRLSAA